MTQGADRRHRRRLVGGRQPHPGAARRNPDCEIVAVNRLGASRARRGAARPSASRAASRTTARCSMRCRWTASSSPRRTRLHFEHATAALEKGCHVLVEKPLTTTAEDARALVALAKRGGPRDRRPLWLEFQALGRRGAAAGAKGVGRIEHVVLQMANALDDLFAGKPMKETEGAMFRPPASTWADPKARRRLRLGPARAPARPALPHRRSRAAGGLRPDRHSRRPASTITMRRWSASPAARPARSPAPRRLPKGRPVQIDLRIFGSEGMLLLDIERERLELRRRDGKDEVVPMKPGDRRAMPARSRSACSSTSAAA